LTQSGLKASRIGVHLLAAASGLAALSWEVLWQIKASLALGVSAWGTAITIAATMGGMSLGSFLMGRLLGKEPISRPTLVYATLEIIIGLAGLCLGAAFHAAESLDTWVYSISPGHAALVYTLAIIAVLGVPTVCMGATLPVFGLLARQFRTSIATLYGLNTLGAACGALIAAFIIIPNVGIAHAIEIIAAVNLTIGLVALTLKSRVNLLVEDKGAKKSSPQINLATAEMIVIVTGLATFMLEIAWFRSLTAAFRSTTTAFAIMLSVVLIALGFAARLAPLLKRLKLSLGVLIGVSGVLVLLATPLIERFDLSPSLMLRVSSMASDTPSDFLVLNWFLMTLYIMGPPLLFMGVALPWVLDDQKATGRWGRLYALNTLAAIAGSLGAAWIFLPTIGFARTAWLVGVMVVAVGCLIAPRKRRGVLGVAGLTALLIAVSFNSGAGRTRVQGHFMVETTKSSRLLKSYEGPDMTVSAIEYDNGGRALIVDGFLTAGQFGAVYKFHEHYMEWMGRLPMLLNPDPKNALVICFGTGQTLNAVRNENPQTLDIVDINPRVLKLASYFPANEDVLSDVRVKATIMDGRAYMRRTQKMYDVITLEPMPPNFAGVNALYDKEFYQLARRRLNPHGVIAQWLPFHLVAPYYSASIARTFIDTFPNAILWVDPLTKTGILLGSKDDTPALGSDWPGFVRTQIERDMSEDDIKKAVLLTGDALHRYANTGALIDDDNQLLSYGEAVESIITYDPNLDQKNFDYIARITGQSH
jgi:spermidine synthase